MKALFGYLFFGAALVSASCGDRGISTPLQPSPVAGPVGVTGLPPGPARRQISLGQPAHVRLDTAVHSGIYCEVGNDPVPCEWFSVDVPQQGTLTISVEFDGPGPMFVELGNLAVAHLGFVMGDSPLVISRPVAPGLFPFRVGLYAPWGRSGSIDFRVLATMR